MLHAIFVRLTGDLNLKVLNGKYLTKFTKQFNREDGISGNSERRTSSYLLWLYGIHRLLQPSTTVSHV
jgi:hypothetical protein